MSLDPKKSTDEAQLIADLKATFPGCDPRSLRTWSGDALLLGAVIAGEAEMPDGYAIAPCFYPDAPEYDGWVHKAFEAWVEARGWYVEVYDAETLWVIPLPTIAIACDKLRHAWYPPVVRFSAEESPF